MGERFNTEDYVGTFGVGVGCRLVQSGIDLDTLRVNSCFSVGNGRGIMVGVDGMRSFTLVGSTVGAIDEGSVRNAGCVGRSIPLVRSRVDAIDGSGEGKLVGCVAGVS